jgi:hypothetical protein
MIGINKFSLKKGIKKRKKRPDARIMIAAFAKGKAYNMEEDL